MMDAQDAVEPISAELDSLTVALIEYGLDELASTGELSVSLALGDEDGNATLLSFDDDDFDESIDEAHATVQRSAGQQVEGLKGACVRYAIAYDGAIDEDGTGYEPALIVEYGEQGMSRGYSAYLTYEHPGEPQDFVCSQVAPAGVVELLV